MYGALLGDMIGAPFEFDRSPKTKEFPLFGWGTEFTDDSVMTIAVAEALLDSIGKPENEVRKALVASMQKWGHRYPDAGYGARFYGWLEADDPQPYGSFGNGSAMRVSAAGWMFDTLEETRRCARLTADVTHNHPEGIKGAEAAASAIYMSRNGFSKEEIREYIIREFGYDLSRTCDEIRPEYYHVESCQKTVPEAITAFLEGTDFEDVIRTAVSLGGDCDTLTCIAGGMAEAFYGVPVEMKKECRKRLPEDMLEVLDRFEAYLAGKKESYQDINAETIDRWIREGWEWGKPISHETYEKAKNGEWEVLLTPTKPVPREWLGDLKGKKILGLASGGGQQMPIFAALGAVCTVLDYSLLQIENERLVAEREGYDIRIIRGDMTKRLPFEDGEFDIIFHPVSNCYVEEVKPIWKECFRILKPGGKLVSGTDHYINYIVDQEERQIVNRLPFNPLKNPDQMKQLQDDDAGVQFSHSLEEQIGGQLEAGFRLLALYEDTNGEDRLHEMNIPTFLAMCAEKPE